MFKQITGKTILIGICLLGPTLSVLVYLATRDIFYSSLSLACSTIVSLALARLVLIEPGQAKLLTVVRIFAVGITCATTPLLFTSPFWIQAANQLIHQYYPGYEIPEATISNSMLVLLSAIIVVATVAVVFFVLESNSEPNAAVRRPTILTDAQLDTIGRTLEVNIDNLDRELRFFDFQSPAIDPKLELLSTTSRFPKTQTMVEVALSAEDGEFILAKGEPGSGKSVMLRSLTRHLIARIPNGGKMPLLLNMRDWPLAEGTDELQILREFHAWARGEFGRQIGSHDSAASNEQYEQLYAEGSFIFLIDSFDENQAVSNSAHHGAFIGTLSHVLVEYVRASGGCVGLTLSREYNSPSTGWIKHKAYVVRPFSDSDIKRYIAENCTSAPALAAAVLGERRDLYVMAKTPLLLALLVDYCNSSGGTLPSSEFEVFDSFIERKIAAALQRLGADQEAASEAWRSAKQLARKLASHGAPAPGGSSTRRATAVSAEGLSILREAKLLKRSGIGESFAHKRFQEYFRVRSMLDGGERAPSLAPDRIDENRDVLNLFAQTCSNRRARRLAEEVHRNLREAFGEFEAAGAASFYEATILNLRFLRNAFRNRPNILNRHRQSIREVIVLLWNRQDILNQKHAVEHIALLPPETASSLVRSSLLSEFPLLRRVALLEARYVGVLQPWLGRCLAAFLSRQDDVVLTLELFKGGMWSAMANAARADVASVITDAFLRVTVVTLVFATVFWNLPLLGGGTSLLLVGLYAAFQIVGRGSELGFLARLGFNPGLSGLVACNAITATLIGLGAIAFGSSREMLWGRGDLSSLVSVAVLCAAIAMPINNMLVRMRDGLDDLGEVAPVTSALRAFGLTMVIAFFKEHWFIVIILLLAVLGRVTRQAGWALSAIFMIWFVVTIGTVLEGAISRLRANLGARLDRPKGSEVRAPFFGSA